MIPKKNNVLGTMFYRYISENLCNYINNGEIEAGNIDFDFAKMADFDAEEAREGLVEEKGFFILPSELFCNVRANAADDVLISINKAIDASPELRSKKQLIETFIAGINDADDIMDEWHSYVVEQRETDLDMLIIQEKLKANETRKFVENAFRDGEIKTAGTDIDKLLPPISRFGGGRDKKKQQVIDKLNIFFEKYYGIGGTAFSTKSEQILEIGGQNSRNALKMVAEPMLFKKNMQIKDE